MALAWERCLHRRHRAKSRKSGSNKYPPAKPGDIYFLMICTMWNIFSAVSHAMPIW